MFSMEEMLSKRNQFDAMNNLLKKKDGHGKDGMNITDFKQYWDINHKEIIKQLLDGNYEPGVIMTYEIVNGKGKVREVSSLNVIDRFIARLLSQKMRRYIEPLFCKGSYAYQENKGIVDAVTMARSYINGGDTHVCEIDI